MTKGQTQAYLLTPMLIGFVLCAMGVYVSQAKPEMLHGIVLICTGLIAIILGTLMSLLIRLHSDK